MAEGKSSEKKDKFKDYGDLLDIILNFSQLFLIYLVLSSEF